MNISQNTFFPLIFCFYFTIAYFYFMLLESILIRILLHQGPIAPDTAQQSKVIDNGACLNYVNRFRFIIHKYQCNSTKRSFRHSWLNSLFNPIKFNSVCLNGSKVTDRMGSNPEKLDCQAGGYLQTASGLCFNTVCGQKKEEDYIRFNSQ